MTSLSIIVAHAGADCAEECMASWGAVPVTVWDGSKGMLEAYQEGWKMSVLPPWKPSDILGFVHDDVLITERDWQNRVLKEFEDPAVGLMGFGGALGHGHPDMYRIPYQLQQLGRSDYISNVEDWEIHGQQIESSTDVAVLDGFALFVRRSVLDKVHGWPLGTSIGYSCYDYWLACAARRQGYRIRVVGVRCLHLGGRTAVARKMEVSSAQIDAAHRFIYDEFADVLPFRVRPS